LGFVITHLAVKPCSKSSANRGLATRFVRNVVVAELLDIHLLGFSLISATVAPQEPHRGWRSMDHRRAQGHRKPRGFGCGRCQRFAMQSMDFAEHHHHHQHQDDTFSTQHHAHRPNNTPHPLSPMHPRAEQFKAVSALAIGNHIFPQIFGTCGAGCGLILSGAAQRGNGVGILPWGRASHNALPAGAYTMTRGIMPRNPVACAQAQQMYPAAARAEDSAGMASSLGVTR